MFGARELSKIFDILKENDMIGERIYFSNLFYMDVDEKKNEILWIETPKDAYVYSEVQVCINDKEEKLFGKRVAITMIYLEIQKIAREYNK
jgi:hypothetical protein